MATAQKSIDSVPADGTWLPGAEIILLKEIMGPGSEDLDRNRAERVMRVLHPRLKPNAIQRRLAPLAPDSSPQWRTVEFWLREIDFVLLEGIHSGRHGQSEVIERICRTWAELDAKMLKQRMEELAHRGLPKFLQEDFWQEEGIDPVLLAGLKAGGQALRHAVGKVQSMQRDLRVEVIWARVRRLRKQSRKKSRRGLRCAWTKELDQQLFARSAGLGLSAAVSEIRGKTGWSRAAIVRRAHKLGVATGERGERSPWTEADRNFLAQSIRHVPVKAIARELGRTENAVWCKIWEEGLRAAYEEDYSQRELCRRLHVRAPSVRGWIEKGWLKLGRNDRVKDRSLKAFFQEHGNKLNWERVDRAWIDEVIGNADSEESGEEQAMEHGQSRPTPLRKIGPSSRAILFPTVIAKQPIRPHAVKPRIPRRKITERVRPTLSLSKTEDLVVNPGDQPQPQKLPLVRVTATIGFGILEETWTTLFEDASHLGRNTALGLHS